VKPLPVIVKLAPTRMMPGILVMWGATPAAEACALRPRLKPSAGLNPAHAIPVRIITDATKMAARTGPGAFLIKSCAPLLREC